MKGSDAKRVLLDVSFLEVASAALCIGIGIITSSYQQPLNDSIDVSAYQNFGIMCGVVVGLAGCFLGSIGYIVTIRHLLHHEDFHLKSFLFSCALIGGAASTITFILVGVSGVSYGMVEREVLPVATDGVMSAIIGAIVGLSAGWVLNKVRGYD
jgi:hypothetical protein